MTGAWASWWNGLPALGLGTALAVINCGITYGNSSTAIIAAK
jgi:hypothetical protein